MWKILRSALCLAFTLIGLSVPAAMQSDVSSLQVVSVTPDPDATGIATDSTIVVAFDRPVVPLTPTANQGELPQPLSLYPHVDGSGVWVNTSIYVFTPSDHLAGATRYTVTTAAGLRAADDSQLGYDYFWSFSTQAAQILDIDFSEFEYLSSTVGYAGLDTTVSFVFNQPMSHAFVEDAFSLTRADSNDRVPGHFTWAEDSTQVTFTPDERLQIASSYVVGVAGLVSPNRWSFNTYPLPRVRETTPYNGASDEYPRGWVSFEFVSPMNFNTFRDRVRIEPEPEEWTPYAYDSRISFQFDMQFATRYTVTILAGVEDIYGNRLAEDVTVSFTTSQPTNQANITCQSALAITSAAGQITQIPGGVSGTSTVDIELSHLPLGDLPRVMERVAWVDTGVGDGQASHIVPEVNEENVVRRWRATLTSGDTASAAVGVPIDPPEGRLAPGLYRIRTDAEGDTYNDQCDFALAVATANLTIKRDEDGLLVWVTDLQTATPLEGIPVTVYDYDGQAQGTSVTDADGLARLPSVFVTATTPDGYEYAAPHATVVAASDSVYGIWTTKAAYYVAPGGGTYLYTDRAIYRPGETVYFRGVMREGVDIDYAVPEIQSIEAHTYGYNSPDDLLDVELPVSPFGTFSGSVTLREDQPLGQLLIAVGEPVYYTCGECYPYYGPSVSVEVAEYRVPEVDVEVTPQTRELTDGDVLNVLIDAQYYSGGGVPDAPVEVTIYAREAAFRYSGPGRYSFRNDTPRQPDEHFLHRYYGRETALETNEHGQILITEDMSGYVPRSALLTVEAGILDPTGASVGARAQVVLHPADLYVGLHMEDYFVEAETSADIDLIVVGQDSIPVAGVPVRLELSEIRWTRTEVRDEWGRWEWIREEIPAGTQIVTSDLDGTAHAEFEVSTAGIYRAVATVTDREGRDNHSTIEFYATGSAPVLWGHHRSHELTMIADRSSYKPGETARILIPVPFVERGDTWLLIGVERKLRYETDVIQATGTTVVYEIPITEDHVPNIEMNVVMVQGAGPDGLPDYRTGAIGLAVEPVRQRLHIDVEPSSTAAHPDETIAFDLHVTDSDGQPVVAELGISLVDQAVLDLRPLPDRALESVYYSPRPNAVKTTTGMTALLELQYTYEHDPGGGQGGGGGGIPQPTLRDTFVTTPLWSPHVVTDAQGMATISVEMPDNLTRWRLNVKGITPATQVGETELELVSRLPFWIQPGAPRFFVAGDRVRLIAVIHNGTDEVQQATVTLDAAGLDLLTEPVQRVTITAGGQVRVTWDVVAGQSESVDLIFAAVADSGLQDAVKPRLGESTTIPVYRYTARDIVGTSGVLFEPGVRVEQIALPTDLPIDDGALVIETSPSLAMAAVDQLDRFVPREGASTEAAISTVFPAALAANALSRMGADTTDVGDRLADALEVTLPQLAETQNADGGWGWFGGLSSDQLVSAYVVIGLGEAHAAGHKVPDEILRPAIRFLRRQLATVDLDTPAYALDRQAFVLFALTECSRHGLCTGSTARWESPLSALLHYREKLSTAARAFVLMSLLGIQPDSPLTDTLVSDLTGAAVRYATSVYWEEPDAANWGSTHRTTAVVLMALLRAAADPAQLPDAVRWLAQSYTGIGWRSTQAMAWSVAALAEWMVTTGEGQADYPLQIILNGDTVHTQDVSSDDIARRAIVQVPADELSISVPNQVAIEHGEGPGALYYTAALDVRLPAERVDAVSRGISVTREYFVNDDELPSLTAQVGDRVTVRLTLIVASDLEYVIVDDRLPAGLEAADGRLATAPPGAPLPALTRDDPRWFWGMWAFSRTALRDEGALLHALALPRGTYVYSYPARAVSAGEFQAVPAVAQQMYFPDVFGRSAGAIFRVTGP
ncbi:MAG: Ig-like domain-containing protein [Chloroflexi bacterium]|nr:Ig-like domain-containing protein [Chloroflexota bacterium]